MDPNITLYINDRFRNRKVDFFNNFSFSLSYDSVASKFGFNYFFDPFNIEHKELSCVTHYHEVVIKHGDEQMIKGIIVGQGFRQSSKPNELANFTGYSLPGVLTDCNIPPDIFPLQSDGLSLRQIAEKLIKPFTANYGLTMIIDPDVADKMNKVFKSSTASATQSIKDYLTDLASQKNIILSHDVHGRLLFTEAKTKQQPIVEFDLTKPTPKGTSFAMDFEGQGMHSHITMMGQAGIDGGNAREYTIRNPYVINTVYRPKTLNQSSGDDNDTQLAARRALGNELRNVKLTINTDSWLINGKFILPNTTIRIFAPHLYLYNTKDWFVESVDYAGDSKSQTATINCVLPEVYNNDDVVSVFREINLHALGL